jgi:CheY-like chemotaxis protein
MGALLQEQGISVVGGASRGAEALRQIAQLTPDVVLIDIDLGDCLVGPSARLLADRRPQPPAAPKGGGRRAVRGRVVAAPVPAHGRARAIAHRPPGVRDRTMDHYLHKVDRALPAETSGLAV